MPSKTKGKSVLSMEHLQRKKGSIYFFAMDIRQFSYASKKNVAQNLYRQVIPEQKDVGCFEFTQV